MVIDAELVCVSAPGSRRCCACPTCGRDVLAVLIDGAWVVCSTPRRATRVEAAFVGDVWMLERHQCDRAVGLAIGPVAEGSL